MGQRGVSRFGTIADHPPLNAQYDIAANAGLSPDQIGVGTHKLLWWTCEKGPDHRWQASGRDRLHQATGCPMCAGRRASITNSLANHPVLAAQFDVAANGGRAPNQVVAGTGERLWWTCEKGPDHRWQASGDNRLGGKTGCPFCAGRRASITNTLANHPELAAQFDVGANDGRTPEQVVAGTHERLWWTCGNGPDHRWQERGSVRLRPVGCPFCAGRRVSITNSLANHPELVAQFDVAANGGRTPHQLVATSHEQLWWRCPVADDHRWQNSGSARVSKGSGCLMCAGYLPSTTNNLVRFPDVAAQFDVEANGGLTPDRVVAGTMRKLWWACPVADDHRWRASGQDRTARGGTGCPMCAGKRPSITNNLARFPRLAAQLDIAANGGLTPEQVVAGTSRMLWWICPHNPTHRWPAPGYTRIKDIGCPICVLVHQSAREIRLAAELAAVLDIDLNEHRVTVPGARPLQIDVLCPRRRLAVEYDGFYFHEHKLLQDRRKTEQLLSFGYTVIRVREDPLPLVGAHDVAISPKTPIHEVAARVLERLATIRPGVLQPTAAAAYRAGGGAIATAAAEQRLAGSPRIERRGVGRGR